MTMKNKVKDYEMKDGSGVGLYVGTYRKYNEGSLYGMWVDLESVYDAEEFFDVCRQLHDDEEDPELMFQDFQGFPEELYHESMGEKEVQNILDWIALTDNDKEVVEAYCELHCESIENFADFVDEAKSRCMGRFDSFSDFTDMLADEEIACRSLGKATEFFEKYFDYDQWERDLSFEYDMSESGYIFS